jgi:hypothetical protein
MNHIIDIIYTIISFKITSAQEPIFYYLESIPERICDVRIIRDIIIPNGFAVGLHVL